MKKLSKGFTLIEVIITVAIVAIITSIALPTYQEQIERGNLAECSAFAYTMAGVVEKYYTVNLTYPASLTGSPGLALGNQGVLSETEKCKASIVPIGGTCALKNASQRCYGYTLNVTRTGGSGGLANSCKTLTLNHQGEKGAKDSAGSASDVEKCWR